MQYTTFGRKTGLRVSQLALGTGNFGTGWGHGAERDEARKIFDAYTAVGGNFIDTADNYQVGQSEKLVGEFIKSERDHFVVASKFTLGSSGKESISRTGNSRKNMVRSVEDSLKRLDTDHIDLYWAHMDDGHTPMEEILRAFDDLVSSGKILYAGLSNFPAWRIARGDLLAERNGWAPIAGIQVEYSLAQRTPDRELLPMAEALGLGAALWSPLGGGFLTGKYRQSDEGRLTAMGILVHTEKTQRETALLDAVLAVAAEHAVPATHIAIAWLLQRAAHSPTSLIPVLGSRTLEQFNNTIGSLNVKLSAEQIARLDTSSAAPLGVPFETLAGSAGRIAGDQEITPRVIPVA